MTSLKIEYFLLLTISTLFESWGKSFFRLIIMQICYVAVSEKAYSLQYQCLKKKAFGFF